MKTPDLICPECDEGALERKVADLTGRTHGESFIIETEALVCRKCSFKTIPGERMAEFALAVADAYRKAHALLTSADLKKRRAMLGMTQQQFADYLGVGVASVKRWEAGQIQDEAMNNLISVRTDFATATRNLNEIIHRLAKPSQSKGFFSTNFDEFIEGAIMGTQYPLFWKPSEAYIWWHQDCPQYDRSMAFLGTGASLMPVQMPEHDIEEEPEFVSGLAMLESVA